jgi:hypothetical protein
MDINQMMRQTAQASLEAQLADATTAGDVDKVKAVTKQIADLAVQTAPKAPAFGDAEIKDVLNTKAPWFGTDPKKSAKAMEFMRNMDPKKFPTADAFAEAAIKAVDEEFKPPVQNNGDDEDPGEGEPEAGKPEAKTRKTDGPKEGEASPRQPRRQSGPWVKLSDAPADVQADVKRQADKFLNQKTTKEQREAFEKQALAVHYKKHQAKQGK